MSTINIMSFVALAFALPAQAQIRVDARIHTSAGSCSSCDLSQRRMNGMMLQDSDFSKSLFNSSNLSGATFDRANLSEAHFRKALLLRVKGESVKLSGANFEDATLTEAALNNSDLTETDFRRADLTRTTFSTTDFSGSNLSSASAPDANFAGSHFISARMDHMNLRNAVLSGGNFTGAKFGDAMMLDAKIDGANLSGADLSQVQGLKQTDLDMACGDSDTRLPVGFSVPYCADTMTQSAMAHRTAGQGHIPPHMARAAADLDDAIENIEKLLSDPPGSDKKLRRKLQAIHADVVASRKAIER